MLVPQQTHNEGHKKLEDLNALHERHQEPEMAGPLGFEIMYCTASGIVGLFQSTVCDAADPASFGRALKTNLRITKQVLRMVTLCTSRSGLASLRCWHRTKRDETGWYTERRTMVCSGLFMLMDMPVNSSSCPKNAGCCDLGQAIVRRYAT